MQHLGKLVNWIRHHYFSLVIILFLVYSAFSIYYFSFVIHGERIFTLSDDEMISMRYAYNLIHGQGLVWNPGGERVEGITNPLWVLIMAFVYLVPLPLIKISIVIQILGILLMVASLYFVKKLAELVSNNAHFVVFLSLLFTAFYYPLINWNVNLGTEVSLLTLLLTAATYIALSSVQQNKFSHLLFILLGIGIWVRMDFFIPATIIIAYVLFFNLKHRKKYIMTGIPVTLSFLLLLEVLRLWYYRDLLPNTYYDKMVGVSITMRLARGVYVAVKAFVANIISLSWILLFAPYIYVFYKKDKNVLLLLSLFTGLILYNIYVGGDVWEHFGGANRFVAFGMPLFFVSLFMSLNAFRTIFCGHPHTVGRFYRFIEIACLCLFFLVLNKGSNNTWSLPQLFFTVKPLTVIESEARANYAYRLAEFTKPTAAIAIAGAGLIPYLTPRNYVDELGKSDKVIAREPARTAPQELVSNTFFLKFYPGHMKWDYPYVVKRYKPDVFAELYQRGSHNEKYLLSHGYVYMTRRYEDGSTVGVFVLKGSKNVNLKNFRETQYPVAN